MQNNIECECGVCVHEYMCARCEVLLAICCPSSSQLSAQVSFDGKLLALCDRTGLMYKVRASKGDDGVI